MQFQDNADDDADKNVKLWKRIENFNKKAILENQSNEEEETVTCALNEIFIKLNGGSDNLINYGSVSNVTS